MGTGELLPEVLSGGGRRQPDGSVVAALRREIATAEARLRGHVRETPVERSRALEVGGGTVYLKLENIQHTGSFKLRGAFNRLLLLNESERARGVVAASSGNHGAAVAWAADALGLTAEVFVPKHASAVKVAAIRRLGATVTLFGVDGLDTELEARRVAEARGCAYISPYNDLAVVAGQGTIGAELCRQLPHIDTVHVAVGGGGLIAGVAAAVSERWPGVRVVGSSPEASAVMAQSVAAGAILELPSRPTLSDGTAGGVEPGSVTFPYCASLVTDWITVSEDEIAHEMRHCLETEHVLVEGAAAVAVAAHRRIATQTTGTTVIILCGGNVGVETLRRVVQ